MATVRRREVTATENKFDEDGVYLGTEYLVAVFDVPEHDPPAARLVGARVEFISTQQLRDIENSVPENTVNREEKVLGQQADSLSALLNLIADDIELQDRIRSWPHARLNNSSSSLPDRPASR